MRVRILHHEDGTPYVRPYLGVNAVTGRQIRPYHRFPGCTDEEAEALAREWLRDIVPFAREGTSASVADVCDRYVRWCEDNGYAANTLKTWRSHARRVRASAIGGMRFTDVRAGDVEDLLQTLHRRRESGGAGLSGATAQSIHRFMRLAFSWACRVTGAESNVVRDAKPPRADRHEAVALDEDDYARLCKALDAEVSRDVETRAGRARRESAMAALVALNTGMRVGEVCALRNEDVRVVGGMPSVSVGGTVVEERGRVFRQSTTKGRRRRVIVVSQRTYDAMRAHLAWHASLGEPSGRRAPLICSTPRRWMRPSDVSSEFRAICDDLRLPKEVTFHCLRHTFATYSLLEGVAVQVVAAHLGHSTPKTTLEIYAHLLPTSDGALAATYQSRQDEIMGGTEG